jgi:hypothetical protein
MRLANYMTHVIANLILIVEENPAGRTNAISRKMI